jgi:hypothetical protein
MKTREVLLEICLAGVPKGPGRAPHRSKVGVNPVERKDKDKLLPWILEEAGRSSRRTAKELLVWTGACPQGCP